MYKTLPTFLSADRKRVAAAAAAAAVPSYSYNNRVKTKRTAKGFFFLLSPSPRFEKK